jgi:hypothetical protein
MKIPLLGKLRTNYYICSCCRHNWALIERHSYKAKCPKCLTRNKPDRHEFGNIVVAALGMIVAIFAAIIVVMIVISGLLLISGVLK